MDHTDPTIGKVKERQAFSRSRNGLMGLIAVFFLSAFFYADNWRSSIYTGDSNGYYLHLASAFIYHDVGNYDRSITAMQQERPEVKDPREDVFGIRKTDIGKYSIKYTLGVAVLETPFFLIAHGIAWLSPEFAASGWTTPYQLAIGLATWLYVMLGLVLLLSVLRNWFTPLVSFAVIFTLALATNILYHVSCITLAHGYLFFAHSLLLWLTLRFHRKPSGKGVLLIGMCVGLIALLRVPEVMVAVVPLLWGVSDKHTLRARWTLLTSQPKLLVWSVVGFLLVFGIQLVYWKYVSGHWIYNSYGDEGFDFRHPHIIKGWFGYANGWLLYTPVMGLAVLGILLLHRYCRVALMPVVLFTAMHVYLHYSYYAYTFFPGLGSRPMIDAYPLLALPLASCYQWTVARTWSKVATFLFLLFCMYLNVLQTWQMDKGIIWSERGNRPFYWETFGKTRSCLNALRAFTSRRDQPDESFIAFSQTLLQDHFEYTALAQVSSAYAANGIGALHLKDSSENWEDSLPLQSAKAGDWLLLRCDALLTREGMRYDHDALAALRLDVFDGQQKRRASLSFEPARFIANHQYSIWHFGVPNEWGEASAYLRLPEGCDSDWTAKVYNWNPVGQELFIDDVQVELYQPLH